MKEFANLADGGRQLAPALGRRLGEWFDPVLLPVLPNGVPVVIGILGCKACGAPPTSVNRSELVLPVLALEAVRSHDGVSIEAPPSVEGRTAIVIDDGVETGTVARAAAPVLREAGVARLVLAVPVCPREASAHLDLIYDEVIAVSRPLARRSLAWHYEEFDTIDEQEARRLLSDLPS